MNRPSHNTFDILFFLYALFLIAAVISLSPAPQNLLSEADQDVGSVSTEDSIGQAAFDDNLELQQHFHHMNEIGDLSEEEYLQRMWELAIEHELSQVEEQPSAEMANVLAENLVGK